MSDQQVPRYFVQSYQVFVRSEGVMCDVVETMGPAITAWVSKPAGPFAFGAFLAACLTREDADAIADALNALQYGRP